MHIFWEVTRFLLQNNGGKTDKAFDQSDPEAAAVKIMLSMN